MGQELACLAHYGGKSSRGKALLETNEILFRGEFRLKIPLSSIKGAKVSGGELRLKTADGLAIFELGDKAENWCEKILNPKSLLDKLGVKAGEQVVVHGAIDKSFRESLIKHGAKIGSAPDSPWIFLPVSERGKLATVKQVAKGMQGAVALWIIYPKGQKAITENDVRGAGRKAGLTDVKVASFSATHTALKFVIPKAKR
jgi:hypothetical protein